jgi:hypothetical protein
MAFNHIWQSVRSAPEIERVAQVAEAPAKAPLVTL